MDYLFDFSALLFLIVASESIQNSKFIGPDRNQALAQEDNVSFIEDSEDQFESESQTKSNIEVSSSVKNKIQEPSFQVSIVFMNSFLSICSILI